MTDTELIPTPTTVNPSRIVHFYCPCRPHVGLCGAPLVGVDVPGDRTDCVVCLDLPEDGVFHCPNCGEVYK